MNRALQGLTRARLPHVGRKSLASMAQKTRQSVAANAAAAGKASETTVASVPPLDVILGAAKGGNDAMLPVTFADGRTFDFHTCWLADNADEMHQEGTGQKIRGALPPLRWTLEGCAVHEGSLVLEWKTFQGKSLASIFPGQFLRSWAVDGDGSCAQWALQENPCSTSLRSDDPIPMLPYGDIMSSEDSLLKMTTALERCGICIIHGAPEEEGIVKPFVSRIAPPMNTLYGDTFNLRVEEKPINIAYTGVELSLHQDMAYYESPPGIQFLHCIQFDESVHGGESIFADTFVVAEILRQKDPEAFSNLCRIPATFQKSHMARENPAQMRYRRPHISVNHKDEVTSVFWSPPFEGPLAVPPADVGPYYRAYDAFASILDSEEFRRDWQLQFRMQPGWIVAFSNRRLVHGRTSFGGGYGRWMQGAYLPIHDFSNRHNALVAASEGNPHFGAVRLGDQGHG